MAEMTDLNPHLSSILDEFNCQTGTIHQTRGDGESLRLIAHQGIPEFLLEKISLIPFGKGIAGAAAAQREPVELCNLQQDLGGVAKPDARKTQVSGSLAVPIVDPSNDRVIGTLGIGMAEPHEFSSEEKQRLSDHAGALARIFQANPPCAD